MATATEPRKPAPIDSAVTPEQRKWGTMLLELLKLRSDDGQVTEEETYGAGFKSKAFAEDPRDLPAKLEEALGSNPPKMVSAKDWQDSARTLSTSEATALLSDKGTMQAKLAGYAAAKLKFEEAQKLSTHWFNVRKKLDEANKNRPRTACDLRGIDPPNELIPATQVAARFATADTTWYDKVLARKRVETDDVKPCKEAAGRCLAVVDAPANNPEREKLGLLLESLERIDAKIGTKPLTEDLARAKQAKLFEMEKALFAWNDRRTQQNLPPSAEALALADMLQRVHQDVVAKVVENDWPITVADSDKLTPEEDAKLQKSWKALCQSKNNPTAKIVIPETVGGKLDTPAKAKQFRNETLANFARLMGSEAGRHIVSELEKSPEQLDFAAGDEAEITRFTSSDATFAPDGTRTAKGRGRGSTVHMVLGAKDSDVALNTPNGNVLFAPRFIAMGHEMIHGMHASRGTMSNQKDKALLPDAKWNNWEEYQTILKGKTSEQTLRVQYGLSAERFGHLESDPTQDMPNALNESLDTLAEMERLKNEGKDIADALKKRKFNAAAMTDKTKLALYNDTSATGPIPSGWDANQLTLDQLKGIIAAKIPGKLGELGWAPYGLPVTGPGNSIKTIVDTMQYHERSPMGREYRSLGGDAALAKLKEFNTATGSGLFAGSDTNWPSKVEALDRAGTALDALAAGVTDPTFPAKYAAKNKSADKMALLQEALVAAEGAAKSEIDNLPKLLLNTGKEIPAADNELRERDFGDVLAKLNSRTKLALFKDKTATGPLPVGWDPNELTLDQIKGIVKDSVPFKLGDLGWSPVELRDMTRLKQVIETCEAHPKSPAGAQFAAFGGGDALKAVAEFNQAAKSNLPLGNVNDWPSLLKALETAAARMNDLAAMVDDERQLRVIRAPGPLPAKLKALADGLEAADNLRTEAADSVERQSAEVAQAFDPGEVEQIAETGKAKDSPFQKVIQAMQEVADLMAESGSSVGGGDAALAAIERLENEAEKFLNDPENQDPILPDSKARVAQCNVALQRAQTALQQFRDVNEKAVALLQFVGFQLEQRVNRAIPAGPLEKLLASPLLSDENRMAAQSLREAVEQHLKELNAA